jgi:hypothetical protein
MTDAQPAEQPAEHALRGLITFENDPARPVVVCTCGQVASGVPGARWIVQDENGLLSATPSFDWPGHFHTYANGVPRLTSEDVFGAHVGASFDD